jgi:ABC-type Fe3+-hydroxamate transport system substrate-binding protein
MISRRGVLQTILVSAALLAFACERRPDDRSAPKATGSGTPRLAVLSPAMAVILRDLGREDQIVGRHGFDLVLQPSVPVVGNQNGLDYEALIAVRPTHVLLEAGANDLPPRLVELAKAHRWTVRAMPMLTLDDVRTALDELDELTRTEATRSDRATRLRSRFDAALGVRPEIASRLGRVLPLAWMDPVGVMGPGSFHAQMLAAMGATPVPTKGAAYISWSVEDVVRADPDSIVLFLPGRDASKRDELLGPLARANLRAVREGRVVVIADPLCHTPSTALAAVADQIAASVAPWPAP